MFNTTNITNIYLNAAAQHGATVDVWTKVTAACAVVTMLLTALLVVLTIMGSHPTIVMRPVTIPTPAHTASTTTRPDRHVVLNATHRAPSRGPTDQSLPRSAGAVGWLRHDRQLERHRDSAHR